MKEGELQKELVGHFQRSGADALNKWGNSMEGSGWPDVFVWHRVWTGVLELKVDARKYTEKQVGRISSLRNKGTPAFGLRYFNKTDILQMEAPISTKEYRVIDAVQKPGKNSKVAGSTLLMWLRKVSQLEGIYELRRDTLNNG